MYYNPYANGMKITMGLDLFSYGFSEKELDAAYYELTADPEQENLLMESASFKDIDEFYNPGEIFEELILEAIRVKRFSQTETKMKALVRSLNKKTKDGITAEEATIGKPRRSGMFATVTVQIPFSDGQVLSIVFHSPTGNERKIMPDDMIIAFRWLLNKRDVTHVVSPEHGQDVSLEKLSTRVMQIVAKNSEKFQKKQSEIKAQKAELAETKESVSSQETQKQELMGNIADVKGQAQSLDDDIDIMQSRVDKLKEENAELEAQLEALKKRKAEQKKTDSVTDEVARLQKLGEEKVPGVRLADAETAGRMWEMLQNGDIPQEDWDAYVADLYASNKAVKPEPQEKDFQSLLDAASAEANPGYDPKESVSTVNNVVKDLGGTVSWKIADYENFTDIFYGEIKHADSEKTGFVSITRDGKAVFGVDGKRIEAFHATADDETQEAALREVFRQMDIPIEEVAPEPAPEPAETVDLLPANDQKGNPAKRAARIIHKLNLQSKVMSDGFHTKLKNGEYLDLSIETHVSDESDGARRIYFTQYIEEGGDLIIDSEMVFLTNAYTGYLKLVEIGYRGPMGEVRRTQIGRPETSWANMFSKNLIDQGYDKASPEEEKEPEIEPTPEPEPEPTERPEIPSPVEKETEEPEPEPEPPTEPDLDEETLQIAENLLEGLYDDMDIGELSDLIEPIFDLDEEKHLDLMQQVDEYATELTRKKAQAA